MIDVHVADIHGVESRVISWLDRKPLGVEIGVSNGDPSQPAALLLRNPKTGSSIVSRVRPLQLLQNGLQLRCAKSTKAVVVVSRPAALCLVHGKDNWKSSKKIPDQLENVETTVIYSTPWECEILIVETDECLSQGNVYPFDIHLGTLVRENSLIPLSSYGNKVGMVKYAALKTIGPNDSGTNIEIGWVSSSTRIEFTRPSVERSLAAPIISEYWTDSACQTLGEYVRPIANELVRWIEQICSFSSINRVENPYCKGAILSGPSGVGKTKLVQLLLDTGCLDWTLITPDSLFCSEVGEGEAVLKRAFRPQSGQRPSVCKPHLVVFDQLDIVAEYQANDLYAFDGIISNLFVCIDKAFRKHDSNTLVLGITNSPERIHPGLIQPKRLGKSIHMSPPGSIQERQDVSKKLMVKHGIELDTRLIEPNPVPFEKKDYVDARQGPFIFESIADRLHGLVCAEADSIIAELAWTMRSRGHDTFLNERDIINAFEKIQPSSLKGGLFAPLFKNDKDDGLDQLVGLDEVKNAFHLSIFLPLKNADALERMGISGPPKGILLHGPSGNGKTLAVRKLGVTLRESGIANFVVVQCHELVSKVVGDSEAKISKVFAQARASSPCVLCLDQIEAIAPIRGTDTTSEKSMDRILSCLLMEMDGIDTKLRCDRSSAAVVIVIATTADKSKIDPALLRFGRFDRHVFVGNPCLDTEVSAMLTFALGETPIAESDKNELISNAVSNLTALDLSRAEIMGVVREAVMCAIREDFDCKGLLWRHILDAIASFQRSKQVNTM